MASTSRLARLHDPGLAVLFVTLFVFLFSNTIADPDLWGHVRFGQDFWQTGQAARADTYSYLSGSQPWINHEWLAEALFAWVYDLAGPPGLILFKVLITLSIAGLAYGHLRRRELAPLRAWTLVLVGSLLLFVGLAAVRPHMFTYLGFLLALLLIYQADQGRVAWLWGLPPLFALWVNLHGGVLAGVGIFLLWALVYLASAAVKAPRLDSLLSTPNRTVILAAVLSLLALLLNPYGAQLPLFLLRTTTVPRPHIAEWHPISILSGQGIAYLAVLLATLVGFFFSTRQRRPTLLFLFGVLVLMPLVSVRHIGLFGLAALVIAGEHIGDAWQRPFPFGRRSGDTRQRRGWQPWLVVLFLLASVLLVMASIDNFRCIRVVPGLYPQRAVSLLAESGATGNMALHFNWGEYVLWHLGPGLQVSIDGRRETVYDREVYLENVALMQGTGDWDAVLTKYDTQWVLAGRDTPTYNLVELKPGWPIVYRDDVSAIAVKEGSPLAAQIRAVEPPSPVPEGGGLCFP